MDINNLDKNEIHTIAGTKIGKGIVTEDGELFECITYGSVRKVIQNKQGFFNVIWNTDIEEWIIMQYVLLDGTEGTNI